MLAYSDTVMGAWTFGYDSLNRLVEPANLSTPPQSYPAIPSPSGGGDSGQRSRRG